MHPAICWMKTNDGAGTRAGRLRAERDLASEYGVAYDTIRRATALLREPGLIITIVGRGTFVRPQPPDQES
jgi:GntR family transcriptional regulator